MSNKKKKIKKIKKIKTKEIREDEINNIKKKLMDLGLNNSFENIKNLFIIFDEYIITGNSNSGKIELPGLKREIHYILSNKLNIENSINLKYNKDI